VSTPPGVVHAEAENAKAEQAAAEAAAALNGRVRADGKRERPTVVDPETGEHVPAVLNRKGVNVPALAFAREELELPELLGVVNYNAERPHFALRLRDGHTFAIGGISDLRSPTTVADRIAEAVGEYPPSLSAAKFRDVANALLALAELQEDHAGPSDETREWVAGYCRERLVAQLDLDDDEDRTKATTKSHAVIQGTDGRLYLYGPSLHHHVRQMRLSQSSLSLQELSDRLRALGFVNKPITAPRDENGKQPQRVYWRSPVGFEPGVSRE
jgi:hypothetical protein